MFFLDYDVFTIANFKGNLMECQTFALFILDDGEIFSCLIYWREHNGPSGTTSINVFL